MGQDGLLRVEMVNGVTVARVTCPYIHSSKSTALSFRAVMLTAWRDLSMYIVCSKIRGNLNQVSQSCWSNVNPSVVLLDRQGYAACLPTPCCASAVITFQLTTQSLTHARAVCFIRHAPLLLTPSPYFSSPLTFVLTLNFARA